MGTWQVQTAKQRFSEVLREAESGVPQFITRHGKAVAVIIDIGDYQASHEPKRSFWEQLNAIPRAEGDDIDLMELIDRRMIDEPDRSGSKRTTTTPIAKGMTGDVSA